MLFSVNGNKIEAIPHKDDYDWLVSKLTAGEYIAIIEAIHASINYVDIFNASFLPGADWTGTPFEPIYNACGDVERSGLMYGLLCWVAVLKHKEDWVCYSNKDDQAKKTLGRGWTYFKCKGKQK
jgi:hypothetical protein